jgi:Fe-S-cluster containining protein
MEATNEALHERSSAGRLGNFRARSRQQRRRLYRKLADLYGHLPPMQCQGKCSASCGPIGMTELEAVRIEETLGAPLPAAGPRAGPLDCPLLDGERCLAYAVRPLICRLWGQVQRLRCEHGCVPDRWLTDEEAFDLLAAARHLSLGEVRWLIPSDHLDVLQGSSP